MSTAKRGERDKELCFSDDWGGKRIVGRPTLHIVPVLCPASSATHAYGNAHDARTEDQQAADRNQDEPREVEAEESRRILALTERTYRLVTSVRTVIDSVTDQVWMDAKCRQRATEVLAGVLWRGQKQ